MNVEQFDNVVVIKVEAGDIEITETLKKEIEKWEARFYKVTNEVRGRHHFITIMEQQ